MDRKLMPAFIVAIAIFFLTMVLYPVNKRDTLKQTITNYPILAFIDMNADNVLNQKTIFSGDDYIIVSADKKMMKLSDFDTNKDGVIYPDDEAAQKLLILSSDNKFLPTPLFRSGIKAIALKNTPSRPNYYVILNNNSIRNLHLPAPTAPIISKK